jgi:uncharacterized membrane protein YeaQ/YmgE (transglycosylase-associated protein family)
MGLLVYLILLAVSGLIIGGLARLALPGPDPMSIGMTILIGLAGSFIGGLFMLLVTGGRNAGGIIVSVAGATLIVYLIRRRRGGSLTDPGLGPRGPRESPAGRATAAVGPRRAAPRARVRPGSARRACRRCCAGVPRWSGG